MLSKLKILASKIMPWHKHVFFLFALQWGSFYIYQFIPDWSKIPFIITTIALAIYPAIILSLLVVITIFGTKERGEK